MAGEVFPTIFSGYIRCPLLLLTIDRNSILRSRLWTWVSRNPNCTPTMIVRRFMFHYCMFEMMFFILFAGCKVYGLLFSFEYRLILRRFYD